MKKTLIILAVIIIVISFSCFYYFPQKQKSSDSGYETKTVSVNNIEFNVEIADDDQKRARGLGMRENLCENCGMLFEFPEKGNYPFWMKDMKFSIDIIWILDGKVVHIANDIPNHYRGTVSPEIEASSILEINAGLSDKYGFKKGDKVLFVIEKTTWKSNFQVTSK